MKDENAYVEERLYAIERGLEEVRSMLRQLVPTPSKEDFLKHCGEKGIFILDELNKKATA